MDLLDSFKNHVRQQHLFSEKDRLILAVSGGVDSVVLCDLCHRAGYDFVIAHVNYRLRGEESDGDELFVRQLAKQYGVDIYVQSYDTKNISAEKKMGIQETARMLRYDWFFNLWQEMAHAQDVHNKRCFLLTAHHADDQVETLLMNFFKGTGINGLTAIAPSSNARLPLIRPILFLRKHQILSYQAERNLSYREDSSNLQSDYTRNYFRNELIPSIRKVFPEVESNLLDNISRFTEVKELYDVQIGNYRQKLLEKKGETFRISVRKLKKTPALNTVLHEILKPFGSTPGQAEEVARLLQSETGKFVTTGNYRIFRNRDWLLITQLATQMASDILITASDKEISFPAGTLRIHRLSAETPIENDANVAMLDANTVVYPLLLRKWKQGDYFYPLGMKKKKKLSRFFIDRKLSIPDKENAWVIESGKRIIWVLGMRIDERCKITPGTKEVVKLEWKKASS